MYPWIFKCHPLLTHTHIHITLLSVQKSSFRSSTQCTVYVLYCSSCPTHSLLPSCRATSSSLLVLVRFPPSIWRLRRGCHTEVPLLIVFCITKLQFRLSSIFTIRESCTSQNHRFLSFFIDGYVLYVPYWLHTFFQFRSANHSHCCCLFLLYILVHYCRCPLPTKRNYCQTEYKIPA